MKEKDCGQFKRRDPSCVGCMVYQRAVEIMNGGDNGSIVKLRGECPSGAVMQAIPSRVDGWRWSKRAKRTAGS